jgi:hypothetical protein
VREQLLELRAQCTVLQQLVHHGALHVCHGGAAIGVLKIAQRVSP